MKHYAALGCFGLLLAAGGNLPIQPGKWQTTVTITDMQIPGLPAAVMAQMRAHPTTVSACVTPAQAANGPQSVLAASKGKCRYTRFEASGGRLNAELVCAFARGAMTTVSTGSYTATTMDLTGVATMTTPRGPSVTKTHAVARRVGGC